MSETHRNLLRIENALPVPPQLSLGGMKLWCEYPIWGLLLYDDQTPWLSILELIHICSSRNRGHPDIFPGPKTDGDGVPQHEWISYDAPRSRALRHILFCDQHIEDIAGSGADNQAMWAAWTRETGNIHGIDIAYLRKVFPHFQDLASAVALLRSSQIDGNNNRRPTSRHLLPLGHAMILADIDENSALADRRWLRRTGELMYLMINRSSRREELEGLFRERLVEANSPWNRLTLRVQGAEAEANEPRSLSTGYLPLGHHLSYERLAADWAAILSLRRLPPAISLASLARLSGFNMMLYVVERAVETAEGKDGHVPPFVMDMVGASSGGIRKLSDTLYRRHRRLPQEAMRRFVEEYRESAEWRGVEEGEQANLTARNLLSARFLLPRDTDPTTLPSATEQIEHLLNEVQRPRSHSVGAMYAAHVRQTGAGVARPGIGTWYAPGDELIEALVMANVRGPIEFDSFLQTLYERYHIVIGAEEAMKAFDGELPENEASFRENERCFEERLRMLGYLERKSDDCAFVTNPFHSEGSILTEGDTDATA